MIFVVDDDPRIRSATASALRNAGYEVREFEDGLPALAAMEGDAPDLVISDVLMPGMNGTVFVARAKLTHSTLRVLFMSGDIGDTDPRDFGGHELLTKPFTKSALLEAVSRALARD